MNYEIKTPTINYGKEDSIVDKILKIRGIENKEEFLNPSVNNLNNVFDLSNMKEASETIKKHIENKSKIGIMLDIDCDGVTSFAIMYKYLKRHGIISKIIYHQRSDGHGVNVEEVPNDLDLLIIVDSSTNSVDECKELSNYMDIVILDHHEKDIDNPYAIIVNPQLNDYPNKFLSGAGVVFKTCIALDELLDTNYAWDYLDLCMTGLIGDLMNVANLETRYLIQHGLYKIGNKDKRDFNLGLILKQLKKDFKPNATTIAFYLVPFINSVIRLNHIEKVIAMLVLEDEKAVKQLIKECIKLNDNRKEIQKNIVSEIKLNIDLSHKIIIHILEPKDGQQTLNGLIANNIMSIYNKPTFILCWNKEKQMYCGSARNCCSLDIRQILNEKELAFAQGHEGSFGVEISKENIPKIYELFDKLIKDEDLISSTQVDLEVNQNEITWDELKELEKLNFVCGQGFKEPQFLIKAMFKSDSKIMKDIHVKLTCGEFECVKFNLEQDEVNKLVNGFCYDIIGGLSINSWYNFKTKQTTKTKQIMISDIQIY